MGCIVRCGDILAEMHSERVQELISLTLIIRRADDRELGHCGSISEMGMLQQQHGSFLAPH
jgi:hypothetical protein